ncbi:MAG: OB-fold nucleic acid binding domain-containing protein, partial [Gammaproteobacteria bacterium]
MQEQDENRLIGERRRKLSELREQGNAFPNTFRKSAEAEDLHGAYGDWDNEKLESAAIRVAVGGRMMAKRVMGKASFVRLRDVSGDIQLFLARDALPEGVYQQFKTWDIGDILGAEGVLFKTRTGELSVKVDRLALLTKSLRPLPEKFHGLTDQETRYRQRYVD